MKKIKIIPRILEQTTTGGAVVTAGGHVDLAMGTFDRPGASNPKKPIIPSEMVATQLAVSRPPVDDDDYVPTASSELGLAVSEISKTVPDDNIKKFYLKVKELAQNYIDATNIEVQGANDMLESKKMIERKNLAQMISESIADLLLGDEGGGDYDATYEEIVDAYPKEFSHLAPERRYNDAKWTIHSARNKILNFVEAIPDRELNRIHMFAINEFIDLLEEEDYVSVDEANDLRQRKDAVLDLESYKYFFMAAFIMNTLEKFEAKTADMDRATGKRIWQNLLAPIEKGGFGLPGKVAMTVANQVTGMSKKNPQKFKAQLDSLVAVGALDQVAADALLKNLMANYSKLEGMISSKEERKTTDAVANPRQMLKDAMTAYAQTSIQQRKDLLRQSLEKTTPPSTEE